jgi:copper chaperone
MYMKKVAIEVTGMSCGHCEATVQDAVRKIEGVAKVKASAKKNLATVKFDENETSVEAIAEAINATGYEAKI